MRFVFALLLLAACSGDPAPTDASEDTAADGDRADGDRADLGRDAPVDVARDSPADSTLDAPEDTAPDTSAPPPRAATIYVTVGAENRLAVVRADAEGMLSEREELRLSLPGAPGAMVRDEVSGRLYIGLRNGIATVDVDGEGRPSLAGVNEGTGEPVYLGLANEGAALISAYYGDNRLISHNVRGAPPHDETARIDTPDRPHAAWIQSVSGSDRVYVPQLGAAQVRWTDIAPEGGFGESASVATGDDEGPRHIAFAPGGSRAYVVNEFTDDLTHYEVDADGVLSRGETDSTLPPAFDGDANTCADVHIHPSGRYAYASNRGHDSIAIFDLDADTGAPTLRVTVPTEARPREFDLSADGRLLVVAGQDSGFLAAYLVDEDGALESAGRVELGGGLLWATIVLD